MTGQSASKRKSNVAQLLLALMNFTASAASTAAAVSGMSFMWILAGGMWVGGCCSLMASIRR